MTRDSMSSTKDDRTEETIACFSSKLDILNLPLLTTRPEALLRGNYAVKGMSRQTEERRRWAPMGSVGPLTGNVPSVQKEP